jgi:hypothetical protein
MARLSDFAGEGWKVELSKRGAAGSYLSIPTIVVKRDSKWLEHLRNCKYHWLDARDLSRQCG